MTLGRLLSYAEIGRASRQIEALTEAGIPVVWDSGAFSVFTGRAEISVEDHTRWVLANQDSHPHDRYLALDVIGDPGATLANYQHAVEEGARVEPTIHFGTPIEAVEGLLNVRVPDWINVGGLVGQRDDRQSAAMLAAVRRAIPPSVKVHALGCTRTSVASLVPFEGCDSSTWLTWGQYHQISLWNPLRDRFEVFGSRTPRDWERVHRAGRWVRETYGLTPTFLQSPIDRSSYRQGNRAGIESLRLFTEFTKNLHNTESICYLAGDCGGDSFGLGAEYLVANYAHQPHPFLGAST